jgi:hypothetical protein
MPSARDRRDSERLCGRLWPGRRVYCLLDANRIELIFKTSAKTLPKAHFQRSIRFSASRQILLGNYSIRDQFN